MNKQLAYLTNPLKLTFNATIVEKNVLPDKHIDVILDKTYFYPTGGGQQHDTGMLGEARVIDVFKDEQNNVIHRLDRDISDTILPARVDQKRRLANMRHHSAQHILSRSLDEVLGLETLSAKISAQTPSTVDVSFADLSLTDLERVENYANSVIFKNRPVKIYFVSDTEIHTVPLRRPPKVKGQIRVVEIDSFDYSACGGTHCPHTGMIGIIKILKTERRNQKLRLYFAAGEQALAWFQKIHSVVAILSQRFSTSNDELAETVFQQADQLRLAHKQLKELKTEMLAVEVQKLAAQAKIMDRYRLVTALYQNRTGADLRKLGSLLQTEGNLVALLAGFDGRKLSLVVSCANNTGISARELLAWQLAQIGGKGGGSAQLAQGGGEATQEQVENFFLNVSNSVDALFWK